jgi:hypothetical protein
MSRKSPTELSGKESGIVLECLRLMDPDSNEVRMLRIDQPVRFGRSENRRHNQDSGSAIECKGVSDQGELRRRRSRPPVHRQLLWRDRPARHAVRDVCRGHHEILRRIVWIDVDKVFDHRK